MVISIDFNAHGTPSNDAHASTPAPVVQFPEPVSEPVLTKEEEEIAQAILANAYSILKERMFVYMRKMQNVSNEIDLDEASEFMKGFVAGTSNIIAHLVDLPEKALAQAAQEMADDE